MNKKQTITLAVVAVVLLLGVFTYSFLRIDSKTQSNETPAGKISGTRCTFEYMPVCGVNNITYGNRCMAEETVIAYEGECGPNNIGGTLLVGADQNTSNMTAEELAVA